MIRTPSLRALSFVVLTLALGACDKPSEEDCRKAIANMQTLLGTDKLLATEDLQGAIRRCKGASSKQAVKCAIDASSLDQLRACEFMKVPDKK